jgi:hypothetical protein
MKLVWTALMGLAVGTAFAQEVGQAAPPSAASDEEAAAPVAASDQTQPTQTARQDTSALDAKSAAADKDAAAANIVALQQAGYKIVNENGKQLFCKREPTLGSRLRYEMRCLTADEAEQEARAASDAISELSRKVQNPRSN